MGRLDLLLLAEESLTVADDEFFSQRLKMVKVWPTFDADERAATEAELGVQDPDLWVPMRSRGHMLRPPHRPSLALCDLATVARDAGYEVEELLRYFYGDDIVLTPALVTPSG